MRQAFRFLAPMLVLACTRGPASEAQPPAAPVAPVAAAQPAVAPAASDDARGARLYDNWRSEKNVGDALTVDSPKTPEVDGKGGPNGNGSLNDGLGKPLSNTGHDYRLKNLFGWDLRGKSGIYGPEYQNKSYVLPYNLLEDTRSVAELRAWFEKGAADLPAFGQVLEPGELDELVRFIDLTRSGKLARPEAIFRLEKSAPKNYALNPGGDAARGHKLFAESCAKCHGADGRKLPIDETESVGTLSRSAAYEVWFKVAHGHPGSSMSRQVPAKSGAEQAGAILDLLAALCDTKVYPARESAADVAPGDPRCGVYLR